MQSVRSQIVARRTYNRPLNEDGTIFETWEQTVDRAISHQYWLWDRAKDKPLSNTEQAELDELRQLMYDRKVSLSGRTLWLGGTETAKSREASQFNCSFLQIATVYDVVDAFWLLLQGCGVGFKAKSGILNGFVRPVEVVSTPSTRTLKDWEDGKRGEDLNKEKLYWHEHQFIYHLTIGDSAEAWAKSVGKLLALKRPVDKIVLDFSQIRAAGIRLKGYGWISSGHQSLEKALTAICCILNKAHGRLLKKMEIHDILNWLGTTLSSRRSAEVAVMNFNDPEWMTFATWKKDHFEKGEYQRAMSNNTTLFWERPSKLELKAIFALMEESGGSEPAFANAAHARKRAPWFKGFNPCGEILLGDKSFCNLMELNLSAFNGQLNDLHRAVQLVARANYRQTCVNLDDGILQRTWHELNEFLRLTGSGITGIVGWEYLNDPAQFASLRYAARTSANTMADELGLPRSKLVCTIKPSGTLSKVMDCTEGCHKPLGRYIFNNINLSIHDPLVPMLKAANYKLIENPYDANNVLVTLPVCYESVQFDEIARADETLYVNLESAIDQLERYKMLMENYVDHNCSITISYSPDEVPEIIDWIYDNWDSYVGVSFLYRNDPTKTAADLGYPYLPQEVVTKRVYDEYVSQLLSVDIDSVNSFHEIDDNECANGVCPVK